MSPSLVTPFYAGVGYPIAGTLCPLLLSHRSLQVLVILSPALYVPFSCHTVLCRCWLSYRRHPMSPSLVTPFSAGVGYPISGTLCPLLLSHRSLQVLVILSPAPYVPFSCHTVLYRCWLSYRRHSMSPSLVTPFSAGVGYPIAGTLCPLLLSHRSLQVLVILSPAPYVPFSCHTVLYRCWLSYRRHPMSPSLVTPFSAGVGYPISGTLCPLLLSHRSLQVLVILSPAPYVPFSCHTVLYRCWLSYRRHSMSPSLVTPFSAGTLCPLLLSHRSLQVLVILSPAPYVPFSCHTVLYRCWLSYRRHPMSPSLVTPFSTGVGYPITGTLCPLLLSHRSLQVLVILSPAPYVPFSCHTVLYRCWLSYRRHPMSPSLVTPFSTGVGYPITGTICPLLLSHRSLQVLVILSPAPYVPFSCHTVLYRCWLSYRRHPMSPSLVTPFSTGVGYPIPAPYVPFSCHTVLYRCWLSYHRHPMSPSLVTPFSTGVGYPITGTLCPLLLSHRSLQMLVILSPAPYVPFSCHTVLYRCWLSYRRHPMSPSLVTPFSTGVGYPIAGTLCPLLLSHRSLQVLVILSPAPYVPFSCHTVLCRCWLSYRRHPMSPSLVTPFSTGVGYPIAGTLCPLLLSHRSLQVLVILSPAPYVPFSCHTVLYRCWLSYHRHPMSPSLVTPFSTGVGYPITGTLCPLLLSHRSLQVLVILSPAPYVPFSCHTVLCRCWLSYHRHPMSPSLVTPFSAGVGYPITGTLCPLLLSHRSLQVLVILSPAPYVPFSCHTVLCRCWLSYHRHPMSPSLVTPFSTGVGYPITGTLCPLLLSHRSLQVLVILSPAPYVPFSCHTVLYRCWLSYRRHPMSPSLVTPFSTGVGYPITGTICPLLLSQRSLQMLVILSPAPYVPFSCHTVLYWCWLSYHRHPMSHSLVTPFSAGVGFFAGFVLPCSCYACQTFHSMPNISMQVDVKHFN